MKPYSFSIFLFICSLTAVAETNTNVLAIFFLADKVADAAIVKGTIRPDNVRLCPMPVISDTDFIAYDRTNHTFEVATETAKRMVQAMKGQTLSLPLSREQTINYLRTGMNNKPFVLTAFGKPVYFGVFCSELSLSSVLVVSAPVITYHEPERDLPGKHVNNIVLSIELYSNNPGKAAGQLRRPDVRGDPKILEAVRKLGL